MKKIKNFMLVLLCGCFSILSASTHTGWSSFDGLPGSAFARVVINVDPVVIKQEIDIGGPKPKLFIITRSDFKAILTNVRYLEEALVASLEKTMAACGESFDVEMSFLHDNVIKWILVQSHAAQCHPYDIIKDMHTIRLSGSYSPGIVPQIFAMIKHFKQACAAAEPDCRREIEAFKAALVTFPRL